MWKTALNYQRKLANRAFRFGAHALLAGMMVCSATSAAKAISPHDADFTQAPAVHASLTQAQTLKGSPFGSQTIAETAIKATDSTSKFTVWGRHVSPDKMTFRDKLGQKIIAASDYVFKATEKIVDTYENFTLAKPFVDRLATGIKAGAQFAKQHTILSSAAIGATAVAAYMYGGNALPYMAYLASSRTVNAMAYKVAKRTVTGTFAKTANEHFWDKTETYLESAPSTKSLPTWAPSNAGQSLAEIFLTTKPASTWTVPSSRQSDNEWRSTHRPPRAILTLLQDSFMSALAKTIMVEGLGVPKEVLGWVKWTRAWSRAIRDSTVKGTVIDAMKIASYDLFKGESKKSFDHLFGSKRQD